MKQTQYYKQAVQYRKMIDVLLEEKKGADIVLTGGNVINVITRQIYQADIAISGEYIALVGDCTELIGDKTQVVDVSGKFLSPGFMDSHMHFESSMLTITEFTRLSLVSGTTTLVADPHEIGNALGLSGMKAMADEIESVPTDVYLVVPSLVPDSPLLETAGYDIDSSDMPDILNYRNILGVGELQGFSNVKHVYRNTPEVIDDLLASTLYAKQLGQIVDGNAPELFGNELAAHIICAGGKCSCHETTYKAEAVEKLQQGVYLFMREGSTQKNMAECIRAVTEDGMDSRRCILATDDMVAADLENLGHMNEIIKRTINEGVDPVEAIQMATINPVTYFGLTDVGMLTPGKKANIAIINDLRQMDVEAVYLNGEMVAYQGELLIDMPKYVYPDHVKHSVKVQPLSEKNLQIPAEGRSARGRAIIAIPDQNLTETAEVDVPVQNGIAQADVQNDVVLMACVERYGRSGGIGKSFLKGFGMKFGAIAESVAHDTHNIMVCGTNYRDMMVAVNDVIENNGGLSIAKNGRVLETMRLPVGGLITDEMSAHEVSRKIEALERLSRDELGITIHAPFMHLSFLALSTSPVWKLTDKGIVDVNNYEILDPIIT